MSKDEFRKVVTDAGVVDSLNRVLASLYDEPVKPEDPMDYIKQYLGRPKGYEKQEQIDALKQENENLKNQINEIQQQIDQLKPST